MVCGGSLLGLGHWSLRFIGSQTNLISGAMMIVFLIIALLEANHSQAGSILLSKNEVPFFKASLFAGGLTIILLMLFFRSTDLNLWAMIIAQGIGNLYNNWKWPHEVYKLLNIKGRDFLNSISDLRSS
jgi:hypothetical protein